MVARQRIGRVWAGDQDADIVDQQVETAGAAREAGQRGFPSGFAGDIEAAVQAFCGPRSCASAASAPSSISARSPIQSCLANRVAVARPIPLAAPVMKAHERYSPVPRVPLFICLHSGITSVCQFDDELQYRARLTIAFVLAVCRVLHPTEPASESALYGR